MNRNLVVLLAAFTCLLGACEPSTSKRITGEGPLPGAGAGSDATRHPCRTDADCDLVVNPCDGAPMCRRDTPRDPGYCIARPGTALVCQPSNDPCAPVVCDRGLGACAAVDAEAALTGVECRGDATCAAIVPGSTCADGTCVRGCDDNRSCTANDVCRSGAICLGTTTDPTTCACTGDADCAEFGDLCSGLLYCDDGTCTINPATVVICADSNDTDCLTNRCDPATGLCAMQPVVLVDETPCVGDTDCNGVSAGAAATCVDGVCRVSCDDADICSEGDTCTADGTCQGTAWTPQRAVQPGAPCQCLTDSDCEPLFGDDNLCNGTMYCQQTAASNVCVVNPATAVTCQTVDDTDCMTNQCDPTTGTCTMQPAAPQPGPLACATDEDCLLVYCRTGVETYTWSMAATCDDPMPIEPLGSLCVDGTCDAVQFCDDGDICTIDDHCDAGTCVASPWSLDLVEGGWPVCECTSDADCETLFGDDDLCNGTLYCNAPTTSCMPNPATAVVCPTGLDNACRATTCDPATGGCVVVPINEGGPCDDDLACATAESCESGLCVAHADECETFDDFWEPNDTISTATPIAVRFYDGLVLRDDDIFSVAVCAGGTVTATVRFHHSIGDVDLELLDADGTSLVGSASTGDTESVTSTAVMAETWYVRVYGFGGATSVYALEVVVDGC